MGRYDVLAELCFREPPGLLPAYRWPEHWHSPAWIEIPVMRQAAFVVRDIRDPRVAVPKCESVRVELADRWCDDRPYYSNRPLQERNRMLRNLLDNAGWRLLAPRLGKCAHCEGKGWVKGERLVPAEYVGCWRKEKCSLGCPVCGGDGWNDNARRMATWRRIALKRYPELGGNLP